MSENWKYFHCTIPIFLWRAEANKSFTSHPGAKSGGSRKGWGCPSSFQQRLAFVCTRLELQINHPRTKSLWLLPRFIHPQLSTTAELLYLHTSTSTSWKTALPHYTSQTSARAWRQLSQIQGISEYKNWRVIPTKHFSPCYCLFLLKKKKKEINVFFPLRPYF